MQRKKLTLSALFLFCMAGSNCFAQQEATKVVSTSNQLEVVMIIVAVMFCLVILGMSNVLLSLGRQLIEKSKNVPAATKLLLLSGLVLSGLTASAQNSPAVIPAEVVANYGGMDATGFWVMATVLGIEVIVIGVLMIFIRRMLAELLPQKLTEARPSGLKKWWSRVDKKLFTRAVPVEKEQDILLDHDYDGIRELDNALPPWWKYGFIFTIFVAIFYLLNFHVFGFGKDPTEEYQQEMADATVQKELYEAQNADKVDEKNLKMPGASDLTAGKEIFTTVCWACHGKQGEGGAGPNLTDNYWIHKGSLTDIFQSIKHGYPDKGMQAWEKNYSPKEINNLTGYIKMLAGTNPPNPKAPQGELFENAADSSSSKTVSN